MQVYDGFYSRFVVVAGGVISGVGKGVATASIGKIFKDYGYSTTIIKIDPYINYDAGTLRPTEHGEVWVTEDGGEIDQDLGTYERFIDVDIPRYNNITTGQIYKAVIDRERAGEYLGQTVQFIPHIIDEVIARIKKAALGYDIVVVEVGGTVGDYENSPFLYALKSLERDLGPQRICYVLVTYLPIPGHIGEMKTKPTQQAIRLLGEHGILPDFIICRSEKAIDDVRRQKIVEFAHINPEHIIAAPNVSSVYQIPLEFAAQHVGEKMLRFFGLESKKGADWAEWKRRVTSIVSLERTVKVGIVGKYLDSGAYSLTDSYLSVCHALMHAGAEYGVGVEIVWIPAKNFEIDPARVAELNVCDAVIVPGGFGNQGILGKIATIAHVRSEGIPFLGLCYGFQLAVVEFARSVCGMPDAHTVEVDMHTMHPVIDMLPLQKQYIADKAYGGSMRLGAYSAQLKPHTRIAALYGKDEHSDLKVSERHRHRYEVNPQYVATLESAGLLFSGASIREDGVRLMEFLELPQHPFFVATQAHPEFKSRFMSANPLFAGLIKAALYRKQQ
jgi:CTP synthase